MYDTDVIYQSVKEGSIPKICLPKFDHLDFPPPVTIKKPIPVISCIGSVLYGLQTNNHDIVHRDRQGQRCRSSKNGWECDWDGFN